MPRLTFPKSDRLLKRRTFLSLRKEGTFNRGRVLSVQSAPAPHPKLGITASKKYGKAVQRNLFKRRAREAFRALKSELPSVAINIIPSSSGKIATVEQIKGDLIKLFIEK